jgi:hypothetical protein
MGSLWQAEARPTPHMWRRLQLFVLGFGDALGDILDDRRDEHGLLLDRERLPKRIRRPKGPQGL